MDLMPDRMGFFAHENSVISELEADHKMDKKLKIADIAARTGLSPSTVSRVLAGKANTSARAREQVLACTLSEQGVMDILSEEKKTPVQFRDAQSRYAEKVLSQILHSQTDGEGHS